jgi:26S proteasome non-ATPase regulatory subunit 10
MPSCETSKPEQQGLWADDPSLGDPKLFRAQGAKLLRAAIYGKNLQKCIDLLDSGADPSAIAPGEDRPALAIAVLKQFTAGALLFIDRGADVHACNQMGRTALHQAALVGDVAICRALLARGAQVDTPDNNGCTALFIAVGRANIDVCRYLIEQGADVNAVTKYGVTTLCEAAVCQVAGSTDVLRLLIHAGADTSAIVRDTRPMQNKMHLTAFQCAVAYARASNVAFLIDEFGEDPGQLTVDGYAMVDVAWNGETKAVIRGAITDRAVGAAVGDSAGSPQVFSAPKSVVAL